MSSLPVLSGEEVVAIFVKLGWDVARRGKGSHIILIRIGSVATLSVPDHREVKRGTLRTLIRRAGLTVEDFVAALRR